MRRQLIVLGLAVFALIMFAFITATVAAPDNTPLLQTSETEPNNDFDEADLVSVPGYVIGTVYNTPITDAIDYFTMDTVVAREYQASLTIDSPQGLKLRLVLYDQNTARVGNPSSSSSTYTSLSWTATTSSHYVRVEAVTVSTSTLQSANYRLDIDEIAATPTPTNTPLPGADDYEPNNDRTSPYFLPIAVSASATDANFYPQPDEDWYAFYVKSGRIYRASTSNLVGVDTYVEVFSRNGNREAKDNDSGGGFASKVEWTASYSDDYYYIRVTNLVSSSGSDDTYDLTVSEVSAPSTATPEPTSPGPTPIPGIDSFEPNYDFAIASTIATGVTYSANFIPWGGGHEDNDYYKIWIKPGLHFVCETLDLAPGVDTNMIVYDGNENAIGGNDDVELGDYRSRFAYFSTYEGWLYILVGHGGRLPASELKNSSYKIRCEMQVPGEPTATSTLEPDRTPQPTTPATKPAPSGSPIATPVPPEGLTVRALTTPTPVPATTPAPSRFIPISLLVYYDAKDDHQPGAGEGIAGISAQAYEVATNQLLAQGFTDEQGNLEFTVSAQGPVRVSVPFFGFSQLVAGEGASIYLRVPPQPRTGGAP
jgi:hypothetical protein